jgi:hypothetical protein
MGPFLPKFIVKKIRNSSNDLCYPTTSRSDSIDHSRLGYQKRKKKLKDFFKLFLHITFTWNKFK